MITNYIDTGRRNFRFWLQRGKSHGGQSDLAGLRAVLPDRAVDIYALQTGRHPGGDPGDNGVVD